MDQPIEPTLTQCDHPDCRTWRSKPCAEGCYWRPGNPTVHAATVQEESWAWAIVEVFGHRRHVGRTRQEERFGAKMLRVDEPIYTGREEGDTWPRKIVDLRVDRWETHYYGGSAIFSFTPTDEATVMKMREREATIERPALYQLTDEGGLRRAGTIEAMAEACPEDDGYETGD